MEYSFCSVFLTMVDRVSVCMPNALHNLGFSL